MYWFIIYAPCLFWISILNIQKKTASSSVALYRTFDAEYCLPGNCICPFIVGIFVILRLHCPYFISFSTECLCVCFTPMSIATRQSVHEYYAGPPSLWLWLLIMPSLAARYNPSGEPSFSLATMTCIPSIHTSPIYGGRIF